MKIPILYGTFETYISSGFTIWKAHEDLELTPDEQYLHNLKVDPDFKPFKVFEPAVKLI